MDQLRVAFAALLILSVSIGGVTAVDFRDRLDSIGTSTIVKEQITAELVDSELREDRFVATIRLENPTQFDVIVESARFRVYNRTTPLIADGAGERLDDNGEVLPAGEALTVTYAIGFSPDQERNLREARRNEALLSATFSMRIGDVSFTVNRKGLDVTEDGVSEEGS
ncbi:hypothetical protein BRD00_14795 [Halobacteriales archaeon QS_8_69_26]|nr:MAG: hypothetical protein BRD00_14795 [Halobacteriales archaeon QS_8_69_26]